MSGEERLWETFDGADTNHERMLEARVAELETAFRRFLDAPSAAGADYTDEEANALAHIRGLLKWTAPPASVSTPSFVEASPAFYAPLPSFGACPESEDQRPSDAEWRGPTRTAFGNPMPGYEAPCTKEAQLDADVSASIKRVSKDNRELIENLAGARTNDASPGLHYPTALDVLRKAVEAHLDVATSMEKDVADWCESVGPLTEALDEVRGGLGLPPYNCECDNSGICWSCMAEGKDGRPQAREQRTDSPLRDGTPLGVWLLVSDQSIRAFHTEGQAHDSRNSLPTKAREQWMVVGPYDPRGYTEHLRPEPPRVDGTSFTPQPTGPRHASAQRPETPELEPTVLAGNNAMFERCRIVSWIRDRSATPDVERLLDALAERIDAGEHMWPSETGSGGAT